MPERKHAQPVPRTDRPADTDGPAERTAPTGLPAAGPHARRDLTEPLATPGAGTLPDPEDPDGTDATSG